MYAKRLYLLPIAELLSKNASLVGKPEVFESYEHHIIYMN